MTRFARRAVAVLAVAAFAVSAPSARAADLFGKPLRGLTPVSVAAVVAAPERYGAKAVRVEGKTRARPAVPS